MKSTNLPRVTETFLTTENFCVTCGREIDSGARVFIVDPEGWGNVCCNEDCADHEMYALADINPETKWRGR